MVRTGPRGQVGGRPTCLLGWFLDNPLRKFAQRSSEKFRLCSSLQFRIFYAFPQKVRSESLENCDAKIRSHSRHGAKLRERGHTLHSRYLREI
jgi:hypothetical protein